jgi:hypothetical protein
MAVILLMNDYKLASLGLRVSLNLAFTYVKLGDYKSSTRTLLHLLDELSPEIFEAICEGVKIHDPITPDLL